MSFNKSLAYQHALCFDLTPTCLSIAFVNKQSKKIVHLIKHDVSSFDRDNIELLLKDEQLKADFADYVIATGSNRNTLVPSSIFGSSNPKSIFKLNFSEPHENLDFNRLPELDIVNIYEIPLWVKSAFVLKFPRIKFMHRSSILLKGIFDQPVFYPKVHVFIEDQTFYLFITERSKLIFFNQFEYRVLADIVYHILFVLEQKNLDTTKTEMHIYGRNESWKDLNEFKSFFKFPIKLDTNPEKGEHFILAKQLLCV